MFKKEIVFQLYSAALMKVKTLFRDFWKYRKGIPDSSQDLRSCPERKGLLVADSAYLPAGVSQDESLVLEFANDKTGRRPLVVKLDVDYIADF